MLAWHQHFILCWVGSHQLASQSHSGSLYWSTLCMLICQSQFWRHSIVFSLQFFLMRRYVMVLNKKSQIQIWKKVFPFGLLIVFLLPLVFTWDIWLNNVAICTIENYGNLYIYINQLHEFAYGVRDQNLGVREKRFQIQFNLGEFSMALSTAIINAILNLSTILSVIWQRKQISNNHGSKKTFKRVKGLVVVLLIMYQKFPLLAQK